MELPTPPVLPIQLAGFNDIQYYEITTRRVRWLVILVAAITVPLDGRFSTTIFCLLVAATIYNLLRLSPLMRQSWFSSKLNMLVIDNLFVIILMAMTGGVHSPYYLLFIFMIISSAYWYGVLGVVIVCVGQLIAWYQLHNLSTPVAPSGSYKNILLKVTILLIIGWHAERFTDVERRKRQVEGHLNEEVATERQRLLTLINSMADAVIAIDAAGRVTLTNGAALELLNTNYFPHGEAIGNVLKLKQNDNSDFDLVSASRSAEGILHRDDLYIVASDSSVVRMDVTATPIITTGPAVSRSDGQGFIILLRDITKAKSLDAQRDEFISVTSHELRTPLAVAEASLSTALLPSVGKVDPQVKELIEHAHENIVFLGQLVKDLSTLSRAERGILKVDLSMVDPAQLLHQIESDFRSAATEKGLKLELKITPGLKPILTSTYHVHEILQNFVTNALKYTAKGTVTLEAMEPEQGEGVVFGVEDSGLGISASDQKKLFQKFFRSEDYRTRQTGGSGLGLYITQQLATRLGGKVWFKSRLNQGSTFYLQVPPTTMQKQDRSQVAAVQVDNFIKTL